MGKRKVLFGRSFSRLRGGRKAIEVCPLPSLGCSSSPEIKVVSQSVGLFKPKKKTGGVRLWMKVDPNGHCEVAEWDKNTIAKRVDIPLRDLRILGPLFSLSCNILARGKAIVVNLEYIKAIVTAEEVYLLDPLRSEILPFIHQLRQQLSFKCNSRSQTPDRTPDIHDSPTQELPFEFQVLEIALEVVCSNLDSTVANLETNAYPTLDELARKVCTENLERARTLKTNLTRLLGRVLKVRDELEHLLDDNDNISVLYLTKKSNQNQQCEDNALVFVPHRLARVSSIRCGSVMNTSRMDDVEDAEMLLEAYFMQLDLIRNKILSVREYIDDTEDYVNILLDHQRNELIQLRMTIIIASFAMSLETIVVSVFGMNNPLFIVQCGWVV